MTLEFWAGFLFDSCCRIVLLFVSTGHSPESVCWCHRHSLTCTAQRKSSVTQLSGIACDKAHTLVVSMLFSLRRLPLAVSPTAGNGSPSSLWLRVSGWVCRMLLSHTQLWRLTVQKALSCWCALSALCISCRRKAQQGPATLSQPAVPEGVSGSWAPADHKGQPLPPCCALWVANFSVSLLYVSVRAHVCVKRRRKLNWWFWHT